MTTATERESELFRQQDILARFGEMAIKCDNLDVILHEACRLVGEALDTEFAKVMELQQGGATLLVRAGIGWPPGVVGHVRVPVDPHSSEGSAIESGDPVVSPDIDQETRFTVPRFIVEAGVKALVNVNIVGPDHQPPYGVLQVDSLRPRQFTDGDINFLRSYANLLAAAVERLRIAAQAREAASVLRQWNETLEQRVAERTHALEQEQLERAATEDKLRQSQKMEAVGQLTGGLAHDFNNLLTGIVGSLELMQTRIRQGRNGDLSRYITAAMTSANRAAALTHRLLAFSRRQTLDPRLIQANELIVGIEDLLRRTVGPGITLETVLPANIGPILCDPNQLENALLNLVLNARDAMPGGGALRIETANLRLDQAFADQRDLARGDYVTLSVSDTGSGMEPEVVARAFDPFFTTKPLGQGTGLGLSMTYGFVKQSGGQVRIHSQPGLGTTVLLYLPRHDAAVSNHTIAPAPPMPRAAVGDTVLVIDDEPVVRMLVVEVLEDLGYTAIEAADAAAGLRHLETARRIDLMVTDVGLPGGMNGRQLADAARQRNPALKVLFITGFAEAAAIGNNDLEAGMQVMTKPFAIDALATRIKELISSRTAGA
jgi:signal transduction histidine kinase/ActR/RegA family two-component response regulator